MAHRQTLHDLLEKLLDYVHRRMRANMYIRNWADMLANATDDQGLETFMRIVSRSRHWESMMINQFIQYVFLMLSAVQTTLREAEIDAAIYILREQMGFPELAEDYTLCPIAQFINELYEVSLDDTAEGFWRTTALQVLGIIVTMELGEDLNSDDDDADADDLDD